MANLGNVAGVVRSANPPLEADNVTVKTYVLWAQPIGPHNNGIAIGGEYNVKYYDYLVDQWRSFKELTNFQRAGEFKIVQNPGNAGATELMPGDIIEGWWTNVRYIKAKYNGGP